MRALKCCLTCALFVVSLAQSPTFNGLDQFVLIQRELHSHHAVVVDDLEVEDSGELSIWDLANMGPEIYKAVDDHRFTSTVAQASKDLAKSAKSFAALSKKRIDTFVDAAEGASDQELIGLLAGFFEDELQQLVTHQKDAKIIGNRIKGAMPHGLRKALGPFLDAMTENIAIEASSLAWLNTSTEPSEVCGIVSPLMAGYATQLARIREPLRETARWVPPRGNWYFKRTLDEDEIQDLSLLMAREWNLTSQRDLPAVSFLSDILSLSFGELISLEGVSTKMMEKVSPVIADKFHCTWRSGVPRLALGLLAGSFSVAALL